MPWSGNRRLPPATKVEVLANTIPIPHVGCLLWLGAYSGAGYGVVRRGGRNEYTHRIVTGAPHGKEVHHKCRNRWCCNPDHLEPLDPKHHKCLNRSYQ
jgi:HNH endonuclease